MNRLLLTAFLALLGMSAAALSSGDRDDGRATGSAPGQVTERSASPVAEPGRVGAGFPAPIRCPDRDRPPGGGGASSRREGALPSLEFPCLPVT